MANPVRVRGWFFYCLRTDLDFSPPLYTTDAIPRMEAIYCVSNFQIFRVHTSRFSIFKNY